MTYRYIDHTADIGIHVVSENERGLFEEAARALIDILGAACPDKDLEHLRVAVEGLDRTDTLVRWLQELLYLIEVKDLRIFSLRVSTLQETFLEAEIEGIHSPSRLRMEIKAVTYHNLEIAEVDNRVQATIIFDT
ncbi:MAG TPA: archease [Deltaproteobacteria bacterium]|nr:archease [Deltaproteobacteria bacterium]